MKRLTRFALAFALSCFIAFHVYSQEIEETSLELPAYHSINISSGIDIYITQDRARSTKLRADSDVLHKIRAEVKDETLYLSLENHHGRIKVLEAHVAMSHVKSIEASGSSDVYSKGLIKIEELVINASGSSDVDLEVQGAALAATVNGSSDLDLRGNVQDMTVVAGGASDLSARNFKAQNCILTVTGASDAVIEVSKKLSVEAHGASDVRYIGNPEIIHQVAKGSSTVKKT